MNEITKSDGKDTFARIESYYLNSTELSAKDKEIAERMELVFALLLKHRSKKVAISRLIALQKQKGKSLGVAQAWRDIRDAELLFAPIQQYSKEFLKLVIIEHTNRRLAQIDKRLNDPMISTKDWIALTKVESDLNNTLIAVSGIRDEDPNMPDWEKVQPNTYVIGVPPEFLKMFDNVSGAVDLTDMMGPYSEFTEVENPE